jgi:hypothetical protein
MREHIESSIAVVVVVMALIWSPWVGGLLGLGVLAERAFKAYYASRGSDRIARIEEELKALHSIVNMKNIYK